MKQKTSILMILDGFGLTDEKEGNAIKASNTPNLDKIIEIYPNEKIYASGIDVGLPKNQMGNSEVGHVNIGSGRIVYQDLERITNNIEIGRFYKNRILLDVSNYCKKNKSSLHLIGLLSDGGVHSHINHLYALLEFAKKNNLKKVFIHCFLDGRDTSPTCGKYFIKNLKDKIEELKVGEISTVSGRFYSMDRDKRWDRIEKAYNAIVFGEGKKVKNILEYLEKSYKDNITDEFITPLIINKKGIVKENDAVICFNFRADRIREITKSFCDEEFTYFNRKNGKLNIKYVCFTNYDKEILNKQVIFEKEILKNTLSEYISSLGLKQLKIAETEKYAHVTFFFNGGKEEPYKNEDRILIESPKVETYDKKPEMSAYKITDRIIDAIKSQKYDLIVANYANADMVGHTGVFSAAVRAIEVLDECIGRVLKYVLKCNCQMIICSDHGNSDKLVDYNTKEIFTSHTTNPVPFIVINCKKVKTLKKEGRLCDIAPSILDMMDIKKPKEMKGISLIEK